MAGGAAVEKKRVDEQDAARWLESAARGELRLDDPDEYDPDIPLPELNLWHGKAAFPMWWAWRQHGVLPLSGGYLDQPAAWWETVRILNIWYGVIAGELVENEREQSAFDSLMDAGGVNASWDDLRRD